MDPYSDREPQDVRILWGRVAALGGALLLAFLFGTWVADGSPTEDEIQASETYQELLEERNRLADDNSDLEEQLDQLSRGEPPENRPTADNDSDDEDDDSDSDDGDGSDAQSQVYVVRQGDTLSDVALRFYGSSGQEARERIAEANDIEPDATLTVGQELTIPPADD